MSKLKQRKFIWFGIIVLGVILIGIPAAIYAQDEPIVNEWVGSSDGEVDSNADSDVPDFTLGSSTEDFVFTPVNPCRIIDTRNAGGAIGSGGTRSFYVYGSNMSGQGGNAAGCASPVGEPLGVLINIVAVNSTASGYLTVWPSNQARPLAGVLNYSPGTTDPISNAFAVKTSGDAGTDISVYAYKQTHVVADVLGYFSKPGSTMLDTVRLQTPSIIAPGATLAINSPSCPSGYARTGGSCNPGYTFTVIIGSNYLSLVGHYMHCEFKNTGSSSVNVYANVVCARIPGR